MPWRSVLIMASAGLCACSLVGNDEERSIGTARTQSCPSALPSWGFEEGKGPHASDSSPAANTLRFVNSVAWSDDVATALGHSKSSVELRPPEGYLLADQDLANWLAADASVSFWIKLKSYPEVERYLLAGNKWAVSWGVVLPDGAIALVTGGDEGAGGPIPLELGRWYHVAQTRDSVTGEQRVYVDGFLGSPHTGLLGPLTDASREVGKNPRETATLDGWIDEVRIFDRVLTPDEVEHLAAGRDENGASCSP
jgi:hypothetical protein